MKRLTVDDYKTFADVPENNFYAYNQVVESWQRAFIKNEGNPSECSLVKVLPQGIRDYKNTIFSTQVQIVLNSDYDGAPMCADFSIGECKKLVDILQDIIKSSAELDAYIESTKDSEKK